MTARQKALAAEYDKVQGAPKIKKWTARQEDLVAKTGKMQWHIETKQIKMYIQS